MSIQEKLEAYNKVQELDAKDPNAWRYKGGIERPEYESILRKGGGLKENYELKSGYDSTYEDYLANYAQSQTPSPWLNAQNDLLAAENQVDRELETRNRMSQMTKARDAMALGGGMQSGSAEMVEGRGMGAKVEGGQAVQDKYNQQRLDALQQEQGSKRSTTQALAEFAPGRAQLQTGIDKQNIGRILGAREDAFKAKKEEFGELTSMWSTNKLADKMERNEYMSRY